MELTLKTLRSSLILIFIVLLLSALLPAQQARALSNDPSSEYDLNLNMFVEQVRNGDAGELRGLYVPELFAFPIVQQPTGDHDFVSPRHNVLTQFGLASWFGSTGLLAHNYLAGQDFSRLEEGQFIYLVFGDGQISTFVITETVRYQALEPESTSSHFVRLQDDALLTTAELFAEVYHREGSVVLQTCISRGNDLAWGRLFVIAEPYHPVP